MIKNLLIGSVFLLTPISAVADTAMATVTNVIPNWVEVVSSTPQNVCTLQKVPVYQEVRKDGPTLPLLLFLLSLHLFLVLV